MIENRHEMLADALRRHASGEEFISGRVAGLIADEIGYLAGNYERGAEEMLREINKQRKEADTPQARAIDPRFLLGIAVGVVFGFFLSVSA